MANLTLPPRPLLPPLLPHLPLELLERICDFTASLVDLLRWARVWPRVHQLLHHGCRGVKTVVLPRDATVPARLVRAWPRLTLYFQYPQCVANLVEFHDGVGGHPYKIYPYCKVAAMYRTLHHLGLRRLHMAGAC